MNSFVSENLPFIASLAKLKTLHFRYPKILMSLAKQLSGKLKVP